MEHQDIKYAVVQTINPPGWKWSFERDGRSSRTGIAFNRAEAVSAAERAISRSLRDQQR
jgi:YD repeat-containing protein